jgi:hypothetical protein
MKLPLRVTEAHYFTCQNPECRQRKAVRSPSQAKRQRFCSKACAGAVCGGFVTIPLEVRRQRAKVQGQRGRQKRMAELQQFTPIDLYRRAYRCGWKAGIRYMQRWGDVRTGAPRET